MLRQAQYLTRHSTALLSRPSQSSFELRSRALLPRRVRLYRTATDDESEVAATDKEKTDKSDHSEIEKDNTSEVEEKHAPSLFDNLKDDRKKKIFSMFAQKEEA